MNRSFLGCPRTPAPVRNASFLMSAAAVLETPTLLRNPSPSSTGGKENASSCGTTALQPPSAASTAAMQFLMFNQQRNIVGKSGMPTSTSGFNFAIPSIPDSTTTVTTRIIENLHISSSDTSLKRKQEDSQSSILKKPAKRVQFEPLPLRPRNQMNGNKWSSKAIPAITAGSSKNPSTPNPPKKLEANKLRVLTGSVEHILKLTKSNSDGFPLVEVFANVLSVKAGAYECEKILLLRNRTGPIMQGVFYEIDFRMPAVSVGDFVRCVGRLTGGSRLQILKLTLASPEEERMSQRLQTVSGFVVAVKR
ncbi:AAEL005554-PA [Aedes aegypti]|uniref:AAEL005554-PA n=1 Tax=Aedes aegypti TaxID=7159 RepID=Q179N2_AEDAE|nr:AAEL005554-PA [Aedes aegypti]